MWNIVFRLKLKLSVINKILEWLRRVKNAAYEKYCWIYCVLFPYFPKKTSSNAFINTAIWSLTKVYFTRSIIWLHYPIYDCNITTKYTKTEYSNIPRRECIGYVFPLQPQTNAFKLLSKERNFPNFNNTIFMKIKDTLSTKYFI